MNELRYRHFGQTCYIVGKAPSLLTISEADFEPDQPIITLNQAILNIERLKLDNPLYSMQKDVDPAEPLYPVRPKRAALLLHHHESAELLPDYRPRYIFNAAEDFGLPNNSASGMCAVMMAHWMGCKKIIFYCFDSMINRNCKTCVDTTVRKTDDGRDYVNIGILMAQKLEELGIDNELRFPKNYA